MRGVTYKFKSELNDGQRGTGVIAQEMQQAMPEVVQDGEYLSVAYGNLVGVLIESIKELKAEIEELKNGATTSGAISLNDMHIEVGGNSGILGFSK